MPAALAGRGLLAVLAVAAMLGLGWIAIAPNRLLPGEAIAAPAALGPWLAAPLLMIALALPARVPAWVGAAAAGAAALVLLALTGAVALERLDGMAPAARAGLGAGFWVAMVAVLALFAARVAALDAVARLALPLALLAGVALLWSAGGLESLSLVVEFRARADAVRAAFLTHLALAGASLGLALLVALPLAWAGFRRPRLAGVLAAALSSIQVVPALALFALLIPLLSALLAAMPSLRALGLGAIGWLPAVLATAAYLTLPLWRSVSGGLAATDPAAVEAAEAIGMTEGRILREVRLPLALPVFAGGLRVAVVQAIGLVTLGGLVGAGGLGALVFEGLAQFATDLMLLGALPVVLLALLADTLARILETRLARPA